MLRCLSAIHFSALTKPSRHWVLFQEINSIKFKLIKNKSIIQFHLFIWSMLHFSPTVQLATKNIAFERYFHASAWVVACILVAICMSMRTLQEQRHRQNIHNFRMLAWKPKKKSNNKIASPDTHVVTCLRSSKAIGIFKIKFSRRNQMSLSLTSSERFVQKSVGK